MRALTCGIALVLGLQLQASAETKPAAKPAKPTATAAARIEIKGFYIGMPMEQAQQHYRELPDVSIGGATAKYDFDPLKLEYNDAKLEALIFFFRPDGYEGLRDALKDKYPGLRCESSKASTRAGAAITQEECSLRSGGALLQLRRYLNDITTSSLSLTSEAKLKAEAEQRKKAAAADL